MINLWVLSAPSKDVSQLVGIYWHWPIDGFSRKICDYLLKYIKKKYLLPLIKINKLGSWINDMPRLVGYIISISSFSLVGRRKRAACVRRRWSSWDKALQFLSRTYSQKVNIHVTEQSQFSYLCMIYFSFLQSINTTQHDLKQTIKQTNLFIYCIATYKLAGFARP